MRRVFPTLLAIVLAIFVFVLMANVFLRPARHSGPMYILPGNGWTHAPGAFQWTNGGTYGPGSEWIRTEYGRPYAWLVHDQAVGGTRTFTRIAEPYLPVYLVSAHVAGLIMFMLIRYFFRVRTKVA